MRKFGIVSLFAFLFMFLILPSANAYLDPGSGSMMIQIVVGAFAAIAAFFAMFWRRISGFFSRVFGRNKTSV